MGSWLESELGPVEEAELEAGAEFVEAVEGPLLDMPLLVSEEAELLSVEDTEAEPLELVDATLVAEGPDVDADESELPAELEPVLETSELDTGLADAVLDTELDASEDTDELGSEDREELETSGVTVEEADNSEVTPEDETSEVERLSEAVDFEVLADDSPVLEADVPALETEVSEVDESTAEVLEAEELSVSPEETSV